MPSDGKIDQAAVSDNYQRVLRMNRVLTLKFGETVSQCLIAE